MFNSDSSKKGFTSDDEFCEDDWDCDYKKEPKKDGCGCNVSINIYCNKCKKDSEFKDDDFECMSKKGPVYSDEKCSVYVNVFCNS